MVIARSIWFAREHVHRIILIQYALHCDTYSVEIDKQTSCRIYISVATGLSHKTESVEIVHSDWKAKFSRPFVSAVTGQEFACLAGGMVGDLGQHVAQPSLWLIPFSLSYRSGRAWR